LSTEEANYLESLKTILVSDKDQIEIFANKLSVAQYVAGGWPLCRNIADVICYRNTERLAAFTVREQFIVTDDGQCFDCRNSGLDILQFTPEVLPYVLRSECRNNLGVLGLQIREYYLEYPSATEWADSIVRMASNWPEVIEFFQCPSAGEGRCHYALNPNCQRDSPPDMVLLFETKAGWNQHGGAELFTFDNHFPRGGCVLLNKGAAKFIRTEEELKQLRWK
jgi:hypothetical protein